MAFKLGVTVDSIYAHDRFDDLDLDARSDWVGKGKKSTLHYLNNKISNKHYTCYNDRPCLGDLDFENLFMD